jgi:hypothetical protein
MRQLRAPWIVLAGVLSSVLLVASLGKRTTNPTTPPLPPLDNWNVFELADYLNRAGIRLSVVPTAREGVVRNAAFLTTGQKDWHECNRLRKDGKQPGLWRGILYCERVESDNLRRQLADQWGELGWSARPFVFYGDPELLTRVRAALRDASVGTLPQRRLALVVN